ncbi:MAG TPA: phosphotransferase [Steroidobacteraceae bacterium]|nr:phosphotransferase [Steroidobacteraceae bacterium]
MAAQSSSLRSAEDVRGAIASALGIVLSDAHIDSVGVGARNALWRIRGAGFDWMARIAQPRAHLDLDVHQEYSAHRAGADAGMAPQIIVADPERCLLVMQFVPGVPWSVDDVRARIATLALRVRVLHELPAPQGLRAFDLVDGVLSLIERVRGSSASGLDLGELEHRVGTLAKGYRPAERAVFCHNDLHHLNLLGGQPLFIDWEYAALGDPQMDLAALATYHDFDVRQRAELLRCYGRDLGMAAFDVACALFDALHLAWLVAAGVWDDTPVTRRAVLRARVGLRN